MGEAPAIIATDDGDPDDLVVVCINKKMNRKRYHEPSCSHIGSKTRDMSRGEAQDKLFVPCKHCCGEVSRSDHERVSEDLLESVRQSLKAKDPLY